MVDVRIFNDIEFRWRVTINKETVPLEGMDLTLVLSSSRIGEQEREFTVQDTNVIVMKWFGIEQAETGKYTLTLWLNKGEEGQAVVDEVNCVRLVRNTAKIESTEPDCDNLEVQTVELETDIHISPINYAVLYKPQSLTEAEKAQARENIGVQDIEPCDIYIVDKDDTPSDEMYNHSVVKVVIADDDFITFLPCSTRAMDVGLYQYNEGWKIINDYSPISEFETYEALFQWADTHSSPIATKDITDALELRVSNAEANINAVEAIAIGKQDRLVSEINIKTINGESVLGSGDIEIGEGIKVYQLDDNVPLYVGHELYVDETNSRTRIYIPALGPNIQGQPRKLGEFYYQRNGRELRRTARSISRGDFSTFAELLEWADDNSSPVVTENDIDDVIRFSAQSLTDSQQQTARANINAKKGGYTRIEKLHDYIHEIWYDGVDYSFADLLPHTPLGGCTSIRKGKYFARNLDWQYSECCEFFVHTPAADGRHAVDGFGGNIPALTKSVVESGEWNAAYNWLPLSIADGHNDAGLCASMNVVPTKTAPNTYERTTGTNPSKPTLNGLMIVRYILDNHTDALEAAEDIRDNWNVVMPHTDTFDEELHFLIADKTQTIVLEFVGNEAVIIQKPDQEGYITNFRVYDTDLTDVHSIIDTVEPFGQGVERYRMIQSSIVLPANLTTALEDVHNPLRYTHAYNDIAIYNWRTEFAGLHDELTVQAAFFNTSVYDATLAAANQAYLDRTRDGQTWQTTHSVAYDIESGECLFLVQQDWDTLTQRDMALPIDAYTKAETDDLLAGKADKSTTYTKSDVDTALATKVDKVTGKGLSTNDYTDADKSALAGKLDKNFSPFSGIDISHYNDYDDASFNIERKKNNVKTANISFGSLGVCVTHADGTHGLIATQNQVNSKQDKLIAGTNITIAADRKTISSPSELFFAEYNVTSFEDIAAAYNAGKSVFVKADGGKDILPLERIRQLPPQSATFTRLESEKKSTYILCRVEDTTTQWSGKEETLATSTELSSKQDTISDLSAIREGASAGATAVQPDDLPTFGNIVTHNDDEFLPSSTEIPSKTSDLTNDSGYITSADIADKADKYVTQSKAETALSLAINATAFPKPTILTYGTLTAFELTEVATITNEVVITFSAGASPISITIPSGTKYVGDLTTKANESYVMSILDGVVIMSNYKSQA